jgi:hypothetical protein
LKHFYLPAYIEYHRTHLSYTYTVEKSITWTKNFGRNQGNKRKNPFEGFMVGEKKVTDLVNTYDPPFIDSKEVYKIISDNISNWIQKAVKDRDKNFLERIR